MKKADSNSLASLPNIGKALSERLKEVNINAADELRTVGSENAFIRLLAMDEGACMHELMALEGAIQGIRWHNLDESCKIKLQLFHQQTKLKT